MNAAELDLIYQFQELENREEYLKQQLKHCLSLPELISLKEALGRASADYENCAKAIDGMKRDLDMVEAESEEIDSQIKQLENRIYSGAVKSFKELQGLQEKQESLRRKSGDIDNRAFSLMEQMERLGKNAGEIYDQIRKMKKDYNQLRLKNITEIDKIKSELAEVKAKKQKISRIISKELLEKYSRLKKGYKNPVAKLYNGKCGGCRMAVSLATIQEVSAHRSIVYCENCGRILI
ncbi:zinc ribbon domain-containing protein [Thermosediminibacter litoriperuensis]|uniref:zinc ribbon domain-containing protein n=1 Tax=Thermosediminibacter litoriperuensis TaxID=291989 RepID=UPI0011E77489|nr:C4-type zinc ribbon domain-containing protein [Thermosediminibacter litoriperuensis]